MLTDVMGCNDQLCMYNYGEMISNKFVHNVSFLNYRVFPNVSLENCCLGVIIRIREFIAFSAFSSFDCFDIKNIRNKLMHRMILYAA